MDWSKPEAYCAAPTGPWIQIPARRWWQFWKPRWRYIEGFSPPLLDVLAYQQSPSIHHSNRQALGSPGYCFKRPA